MSEREVNTNVLISGLEDCLQSASRGTAQIITKEGEQYVAMISMPEYRQLQQFKALLKKAGLALLQEKSSN